MYKQHCRHVHQDFHERRAQLWRVFKSLLPAGRKFCKITQNRPKKEIDWPGKKAAVRPPILDKSGRKPAEKNILKNNGFPHKKMCTF
jgi:hypothetical protein